MTRVEAVTEYIRLARERPERARYPWLPRESSPDDWDVARIGLAPHDESSATPSTEARPAPPYPEGPNRPPLWLDP